MYRDRGWLYQKYTIEGKGIYEIGRLANRDPSTIYYWLKKNNIKTRSFEQTWRNNLQQGRPKGYKHTSKTVEKIKQDTIKKGKVPYLKNGKHWLKDANPEDNPNWKGGITPERQEFYRSKEWKKAVKEIWKRDNATCQRCKLDHRTLDRKKARKFHIHHIVSFEVKELRANIDNLVLLCHKCHMWVHSKKNKNKLFIKEIK